MRERGDNYQESNEEPSQYERNLKEIMSNHWMLMAKLGASQLIVAGVAKAVDIADLTTVPGSMALGVGLGMRALEKAHDRVEKGIEIIKAKRKPSAQ